MSAAPKRAHLLAGLIEMGGMDEIDAAAADHFVGLVAEHGLAARADLHDMAPRVHDHDQIFRGVEQLPALLDLLLERALGLPCIGQDACRAGRADDLARRAPDRRQAHRNLDRSAVPADADGFEMVDPLTTCDPREIIVALIVAIGWKDDRCRLPDGFLGRIAVEAFGRGVPADDGAVERLHHDRIVGGLDRGAEQALAHGELVASCLGAPPLLDLVLQRRGLGLGLLDHVGKGPRQHAGLASGVGWNRGRLATPNRLDCFGESPDRTGQRSRQQQGERGRDQHRDDADREARLLDDNCGRHEHGVGHDTDDADPLALSQDRRRNRGAARLAVAFRHDMGYALRRSGGVSEIGEVVLPARRCAQLRAELAGPVRMHDVVAVAADDVDLFAPSARDPDTVEHLAHVDIDDDDAEQPVIGSVQRCCDAQCRDVRQLNRPVVDVQIDRRNIGLIFGELDRVLEKEAIVLGLQGFVGNDADRSVRPGAVDTQIFGAVGADDAKFRVSRIGFDIGNEACQQPLAPGLFGQMINRIDAIVEMGVDHAAHGGIGAERHDVGMRAVGLGFELGGEQPRLGFDAIDHARQERPFKAVMAQPPDRGDRNRDQQNHRDGQPGCERHVALRAASRMDPNVLCDIDGPVIGCRCRHRCAAGMMMPPISGSGRPLPAARRPGTASAGWRLRRAWSPSSGSPARHRRPA